MKKKSVSSIKDILEKIIKNNKFEEKLNGVEILKQLDIILGNSLNKYITKRYFLDGIIYLHLSSSVLRSEISYQKIDLINTVNEKIGKKLIKDILLN